jgi:hypothetical protein
VKNQVMRESRHDNNHNQVSKRSTTTKIIRKKTLSHTNTCIETSDEMVRSYDVPKRVFFMKGTHPNKRHLKNRPQLRSEHLTNAIIK